MKYLFFSMITLFLVACEDGAPKNQDDAALQMVSLVAGSARFSTLPQQCPLAVYQTRQSVAGTAADCDQDPAACLAQCVAGNGDACFFAARSIEKGSVENRSNRTFPLFMAACELGVANACVNAAATVKNGSWSTARPAATQTAQCQFRTYDRMCKDGAAWGCYMVAQEYRRSDGYRAQSDAQYEANMRRACKINSESGACLETFKN